MVKKARIPAVFLAAVATLLIVEWATLNSLRIFQQECPNTDVLQPDGNIRLVTVIDRMQDLRSGKYTSFISSYLRGNTWPPLRPTLSLIYFLWRGDPSAVDDVMISFFFYLSLFLLLLLGSLRLSSNLSVGATLFFFISMMLIHTRELAAYSLSAMLETQGMFFLLLSFLFLHRLYHETNEGGRVSRLTPIGLFISIQGLAFTKYPYAAMFFLAITLYEFLARPLEWKDTLQTIFRRHYRGVRRLGVILVLLILFSILLAGKLEMANINNKSLKYFIWLIILLVFIDLNIFLYRERRELAGIIPVTMKWIYACGVFPTALWILLHPDRFSSILGGQFWVPPEGLLLLYKDFFRSTFFDTLLFRVFDSGAPLLAVLIGSFGAFVLFGVGVFLREKQNSFWVRWRIFFGDPLVALFLSGWIQFLALELFSPNKQDRHIYHMLPTLLLISALWTERLFSQKAGNGISGEGLPTGHAWRRATVAMGPLFRSLPAVLFMAAGLFLIFRSGGVFGTDRSYGTERPVCFTGRDRALFDPARWTAEQIDDWKKSIVINLMGREKHDLTERRQDSEIDLLLRLRAYRAGGEIRNDSRWLTEDWTGYDSLLLVAPDCGALVVSSTLRRRGRETGSRIDHPLRSLRDPSGRICLEEYGLSGDSPSTGG